jgi:hypothetical protein
MAEQMGQTIKEICASPFFHESTVCVTDRGPGSQPACLASRPLLSDKNIVPKIFASS